MRCFSLDRLEADGISSVFFLCKDSVSPLLLKFFFLN